MELRRNDRLITKKYKEYFIPTILMTMSSSMAIIVDGIIVGNLLGANALAAVNVCMPITQLLAALAVLMGIGASTIISVSKGKRDNATANRTFTTMCLMTLTISIVLLVSQLANPSFFCSILTTDEQLYPLAYDYYSIFIMGIPLVIIVSAFGYVLRSDGMPKYASVILITSNGVNLIMDVILIRVFNMGIKGAALATVLGYVLGMVLLCRYLFSKKRTLSFDFTGIGPAIKDIFSSGASPATGAVLTTIKILCINHIVTRIAGSAGMVSFSVCLSCLAFVSMLISGASQTMMPILSTCYGEKDYSGMNMVIKRAFTVLSVSTLIIVCVFELIPRAVLALFGVTNPADVNLAVPSLRLFVSSLFGTAMVFLTLYICVAVQKKRMSFIITILEGFVIIVPCAYILSNLFGINGVWLSFILAEYGTVAIIYFLIRGKISSIYKTGNVNDVILELSINKKNISETVAQAVSFLKEAGFCSSLSNRVGITIEEMIDNISRFSKRDSVNMDVLIHTGNDGVIISFCDDGDTFNPLHFSDEEKDEYAFDNISVIRSLASHIDYQRVIGLNKTIIQIKESTYKNDFSE